MLKPIINQSIVCLTLIFVGAAQNELSAATPLPTSALSVMAGNAEAARTNASNYQWKNVNLEVRRIAAAEKQIEQSSAGNADLTARLAPLRDAVLSLRSGSKSHDSKVTQDAAQRVSSLCADIQH